MKSLPWKGVIREESIETELGVGITLLCPMIIGPNKPLVLGIIKEVLKARGEALRRVEGLPPVD